MSLRDMTEVLAEGGLTKTAARKYLDRLRLWIQEQLELDGYVAWPGLGTFSVRSRNARRILHPTTREFMRLPETRTVLFRAARRLKVRL